MTPAQMSEAAKRLAQLAIAYERAFEVYFPDPAKEMAELASQYLQEEGVRFWISPHGDSITCTKCRNTSHNPNDVEQRYCGFCHVFYGDPAQPLAISARKRNMT